MRIVVTGFGKYTSVPNPTEVIYNDIKSGAFAIPDVELIPVLLDVDFELAWTNELEPKLVEIAKGGAIDALISFGQDPSSLKVKFEEKAYNRRITSEEDWHKIPIIPEKGTDYTIPTKLPIDKLYNYFVGLGDSSLLTPAKNDSDESAYLCNYIFFEEMYYAKSIPVRGFVHLGNWNQTEYNAKAVKTGKAVLNELANILKRAQVPA